MDADKDGRLSKSELPIELQGFFEKVDRNGDGFVSRQEDRMVRAMLKQQAGAPPLVGVEKSQDLDYVGDGNPRQMLDLYLPEARNDKPLPVVCWIHGGGKVARTGPVAWSAWWRLASMREYPSDID